VHIELKRGKKARWEFFQQLHHLTVSWYESMDTGCEADEFEKEVECWFGLNDSLEELRIQFREAGKTYDEGHKHTLWMDLEWF